MTVLAIILILLFAGITVFSHIGICIGILRMRAREKAASEGFGTQTKAPAVTVIVPAKDEETNLPRLFDSLKPQMENIDELVCVNDRSTDGTAELLEKYRMEWSGKMQIITIPEEEERRGLNPKQYALLKGIEAAKGEIILFTDADCSVPPEWTRRMSRPFRDPELGLYIAPVRTEGRGRFLYRYQFFDHIFRYFYTAGSAGMGMPTGGFGNNLAVRKKALDEIGGYGSIGYSVTEDAALIVAVRNRSSFSIGASVSGQSAVTALPQHEWKVLSKQERRWSYGAFRSPDFQTVFGYASVMLFLFAGLIAIPLAFVYSPFFVIIVSTFSSMFIVALCGGILLKCSFRNYWLFLLPCIFFSSFFYSFNNFFSFVNIPITWKGKDLDKM